jgi:hypothetical protein
VDTKISEKHDVSIFNVEICKGEELIGLYWQVGRWAVTQYHRRVKRDETRSRPIKSVKRKTAWKCPEDGNILFLGNIRNHLQYSTIS